MFKFLEFFRSPKKGKKRLCLTVSRELYLTLAQIGTERDMTIEQLVELAITKYREVHNLHHGRSLGLLRDPSVLDWQIVYFR